jgi:hypothetical protein
VGIERRKSVICCSSFLSALVLFFAMIEVWDRDLRERLQSALHY